MIPKFPTENQTEKVNVLDRMAAFCSFSGITGGKWNGLIMSQIKKEEILFSEKIRVVDSYTDRYLCFNKTVSVPDCTEPITTQHSMRSKLPASFTSFERNSVPSTRVVVSEIFVALIFLSFLLLLFF